MRNSIRENCRIEQNPENGTGAYGSLEDSILKPQALDDVMAKVQLTLQKDKDAA